MTRALRWTDRRIPNGWLGAIRQLGLFAGIYYVYRLVRAFIDSQTAVAFDNARAVVSFERGAHTFFEPGLQHWTLSHHWLLDVANWCYVNSHPAITTAFIVWLYFARNDSFPLVRNAMLIAMLIALAGYVAFPTAPPRMLPEWGFSDTVANWVGQSGSSAVNVFFNPYAAIPSMHVAFAVMTGIPSMALVRLRVLKVFWALYPLLIIFAVIVTANHFWVDSVLGVLTAAVAGLLAKLATSPRLRFWATREPSAAGVPA